ncbi:MAG TPA: fumarylacetoacetate hydrolase family protein [bacterium]|nr:fumarylacetoacetate hydrolase family protein [bacterium]
MRFASYRAGDTERAAVQVGGAIYDVERLAAGADVRVPATLDGFIAGEALDRFRAALDRLGGRIPAAPLPDARLVCPLRRPPKIWGIGLNYRAHAQDLGVAVPDEPASFMKPATTLIGPEDPIVLPPQSRRVTAEAELALVLGRRAAEVPEAGVGSVLFGYVPVLDMTAEDILQRNPRFLTRAKSFATFLSLGPWITTADEIPSPAGLRVSTLRRGEMVASNTVSDMRFAPAMLVAFFSRVFEWEPGDLLLTGTPGAAVIEDGDVAGCRIDGFPELANPVRRAPGQRREER